MATADNETQDLSTQGKPSPIPNILTVTDAGTLARKWEGRYELHELRELGNRLPVGFPIDGGRSRLFRLKPFRLKEEKALGEIRESARAMTYGTFVAKVLAHMCQTVGPHNFDSKSDSEKLAVLGSMYVADVLYMYLWLRWEALGSDCPVMMDLTCGACKNEFKWAADLGSVEVRVAPDTLQDLSWKSGLRDPIDVLGHRCSEFTLEPLKWGMLERREFMTKNVALREALTVSSSIIGATGVPVSPFAMAQRDMDELTKYDFEGLGRDIEDNAPGPQMVIDAHCPACDARLRAPLDWQSYDGFFSRSSQRTPGRR